MSVKIKIVLAIIAFSIGTFLLMYYGLGVSLKKSVLVPVLAGTAMIVFDVLLAKK